MHHRLTPLRAFAALVLTTAVAAPPAAAVVIARDGTWAGSVYSPACDTVTCDATDELGYFKLRRGEIRAMKYSVLIACFNRDTNETYDRSYSGGSAFPSGQRIGRSHVVTATYDETSDFREGQVKAVVDFRGRRAKLKLTVSTNGEFERCNGRTTIPLSYGTPRSSD